MKTTNPINDEVKCLWIKAGPDQTGPYAPQFYGTSSPDCFLTIGINPSMPKKKPKFFPKEKKYPDFFLMPKNIDDVFVSELVDHELAALEQYSFYSKFREIRDSLKLPWHHIDLFFLRNRFQNEFKKGIYENGKSLPLTKFAEGQLHLSSKLISLCAPKCILIANALASDLFIRCLTNKFSLKFNEDLGFHTTTIGNNQVPIFFSSMITGQRQLDKYSQERLKWHIKKAWAWALTENAAS